jgi:transposase-like protein/peptidoglycan hydrolase CwlO-like protein
VTVRLSPHKISTILRCYFAGVSQPNIARRVAVDQSTVSLYSSRFQAMAAKNGILYAAKEFGIMKEVNDLRSLSVELLKNKLTVEEAQEGLAAMKTFNNLGVPVSRHKELVKVVSKLEDPGFVPVAMELVALESSTGKVYTQLVSEFRQLSSEISETKQQIAVSKRENEDLCQSNRRLSATIEEKKRELRDLNKKARQEQSAIKADIARKMKGAELTFQRIEKIEPLLVTLRKLLVSDEQMEQYVRKHVKIEESGIGWENFVKITETAKTEGRYIDSEKLKDDLGRYPSLASVVDALEKQKSTLEPEVDKLSVERNELEVSVKQLKRQKNDLESKSKALNKKVVQLDENCRQLENRHKAFQSQLSQRRIDTGTLEARLMVLEKEMMQCEERKGVLTAEIKSMEETAEHKKALDDNIAVLKTTEKELQARTKSEAKRLEVLDAFLGLVRATNREDLLGFARVLPRLLEESYEKKYSTHLLLKFIIHQLSGNAADGLSCGYCGADFVVTKQSTRMTGSYQCPACGSFNVSTSIELCNFLKDQLCPTCEKTDGAPASSRIRIVPIN